MGNKANPNCLRLGIVKDWDCTWFADSDYKDLVLEDFNIRNFLKSELNRAGISRIQLKRKTGAVEAVVTVSRPGIIFGKKGKDLKELSQELKAMTKGKHIRITILEEKNPEANAKLLAEWAAFQLEKRVPFRRVMKMAIQKALKSGVLGIKMACSGRLGGAEIARCEQYREGKVPLHTLRADIDFAFTEALTTYGKIGVKVWVYNGDVFDFEQHKAKAEASQKTAEAG